MTAQDLRELIAGIGTKVAEVADLQKRTGEELRELFLETDQRQKETDRQLKETDRQLKETDRYLKETERQLNESFQRTERQLDRLGQQLGGLGEKFGSFTEGMALPSMTKLLQERFHMDVISPRVRARRNGRSMEVDVLAYANSKVNEVYIVEVKSHLREEGIDQMKQTLREFREFFPFLADKKVYGILAVVDAPDRVLKKVLQEGIYLARIHDEEFELEVPQDFKPRAF